MFGLRVHVAVCIDADPESVWARLTDAADVARWNSTVDSLSGTIALGQKLAIRVPSAPGRTFTPTVAEFEAPRKMVWRDGFAPMFVGTRTFTLRAVDGATQFEMTEAFSGLMLPLIRGSLPDFGPIFDQYAADLKRVCEAP